MAGQGRSQQRGISFFGLLFNVAILAMVGVVGAQVFPTYMEFQSVGKAINRAAAADGATVADIRVAFDKAAAIDDIKSISGKDIVVTKEADKVVVSFEYQREIHLFGPAFLTLKYAGRSK